MALELLVTALGDLTRVLTRAGIHMFGDHARKVSPGNEMGSSRDNDILLVEIRG